MKTELVVSVASKGELGRRPLAGFDELTRKFEETLDESVGTEDAVRAIARLSVPDFADYCLVDVYEGERSVRSVFAHRDPQRTAELGALLDRKAPIFAFAAGRRAFAGEPVLMKFSAAMFRSAPMRTPEMRDIALRFRATSTILYPIVVMGTTVAVAGFGRVADTGAIQGPEDLALAREISQRAILRQAGLLAGRCGKRRRLLF
jgi:hypothetical protein